ncbi:hypothetical protein J2W20_002337 [Sinomonas atrocyanea]|uniref:hypothetical protein n=1 Tax=Sinomonas atrocyanea TaxID=37927 RepID=UPI002787B130|nr:hypothetical protein [Sinomonas atrocyanea]MDQ0260433.1 hypothetical protein [Sinomonas atrocyanea]
MDAQQNRHVVAAGTSTTTDALRAIPNFTVGDVLTRIGARHHPPIGLEDFLLIRHTFVPGDPEQLQGPGDVTAERVLGNTRKQAHSTRLIPETPPKYWVIFIADGQRRSRLWSVFENKGLAPGEQGGPWRVFDLRPCDLLAPLEGRLVIEWNKNAVLWCRKAINAADLPVLELGEGDDVSFPWFNRVLRS